MKKLTTSLIAVALMLVLGQCKRNHVEVNPQVGAVSESVANDNDAVKRIVKFKDMLSYYKSNPNAKDGNTMSLADAICDLENTFNATYSYSEDMYSESMDHEFTLSLNIDSNGNVLLADLTAFYNLIVSLVRDAYANDGFENKIFISLLADVIDVNDNVATVKIKAKSGERTNYNPPVPHIDGPFRPGDDYLYDYGRCDDSTFRYGAAHYLEQALITLRISNIIESQEGYRNIYINRDTISFIGGPNGRPGVFYRTDISNKCIEWSYMNDYLYAEKRIIFTIIPEQLGHPGIGVCGINVEGEMGYINETTAYITHRTRVEYAERIEANIEEIGEIENLLTQ